MGVVSVAKRVTRLEISLAMVLMRKACWVAIGTDLILDAVW